MERSKSCVTLVSTKTDSTTNTVTKIKNGRDLRPNNQFCNHTKASAVTFNFSVEIDRLKDFKIAKKHHMREDPNAWRFRYQGKNNSPSR